MANVKRTVIILECFLNIGLKWFDGCLRRDLSRCVSLKYWYIWLLLRETWKMEKKKCSWPSQVERVSSRLPTSILWFLMFAQPVWFRWKPSEPQFKFRGVVLCRPLNRKLCYRVPSTEALEPKWIHNRHGAMNMLLNRLTFCPLTQPQFQPQEANIFFITII